jgi:hypothetical protein
MPHRFRASLLVVLILLATTSCGLFGGGHRVHKSGGSVTSDDDKVKVTFGSGQLSQDTRVTITENGDGPAPVPGFLPLTRPFDIKLDHSARGGTVTAAWQPPAGFTVDPGRVVMFIEENGAWVLVPSTVDAGAHTISGSWPHFSWGHIAYFNPLQATANTISWSMVKAKDGAAWVVDRSADAAKLVASAAVGATGGTLDTVKCESTAKEWTVTNSAGMTGCVAAQKDGMWPAKVNDRYPYPLLVDLPDGAIGPGAADLLDSFDPIELAMAMVLSRDDKLSVPAGDTVPFKLAGDAPRTLVLNARLDARITAAKLLGVLATVLTDGLSAEELSAARAELVALQKGLDDGFIAARKNRSGAYTMAEYLADTQSDNGLVGLRKKALQQETRNSRATDAIDGFFDWVDLIACGTTSTLKAKDAGLSFSKQVDALLDDMFGKCFPVFARASVTHQYRAEMAKLNPTEQLKRAGDLATGLVEQALDLRSPIAVSFSGLVDTLSLGRTDTSKAKVTLTRPLPQSRLTGVNWVAVGGERMRCGETGVEQFFKTVYYDITRDGVPDSFVLLDCVVGAGRSPDMIFIYDGASDPAAPQLLGTRPATMPGPYFTGGCLQFDGRVVTMLSRDYRRDDPDGAPSLGVKVLAMWTGGALDYGEPVRFAQDPAALVKGCTTTLQPR